MGKKQFTIEQIISMLREAEISLSKGSTIGTVCRSLGVSEQTYYRWRKLYGGMHKEQCFRLRFANCRRGNPMIGKTFCTGAIEKGAGN